MEGFFEALLQIVFEIVFEFVGEVVGEIFSGVVEYVMSFNVIGGSSDKLLITGFVSDEIISLNLLNFNKENL